MEPLRPLAPCLVGSGTVSNWHDMLRALETIENVEYRYEVHGELVDEGRAALVKLMADPVSATLAVNGCLFLNVASFRFLDFARDAEGEWHFSLHADAGRLDLLVLPEEEEEGGAPKRPHLLSEESVGDFESLIALDDDEDEE